MKPALAFASVLMLVASVAVAAQKPKPPKPMTAEQMSALLAAGRTIKVTGAGDHYSGRFELAADGTGTGAVTVGGKDATASGSWQLTRNLFCHSWQGLEPAEVCESWVQIEPKKALILIKKVEVGIVTWD